MVDRSSVGHVRERDYVIKRDDGHAVDATKREAV